MTAHDRGDAGRDVDDRRDVPDATSAETAQPGSDYGNVGGRDPAAAEQAQPGRED